MKAILIFVKHYKSAMMRRNLYYNERGQKRTKAFFEGHSKNQGHKRPRYFLAFFPKDPSSEAAAADSCMTTNIHSYASLEEPPLVYKPVSVFESVLNSSQDLKFLILKNENLLPFAAFVM